MGAAESAVPPGGEPRPTADGPEVPASRLMTGARERRTNAVTSAAPHAGLAAALLAVVVVFSLTAPNFFSTTNLLNVLLQISFLAIVAWAMTLVIVAGEIDISVGSAVAFAGSLLGVLTDGAHLATGISIVVVLAVGLSLGMGAGFVRHRLRIPSFIVTLALYSGLRGLALLITNAVPEPLSSGFLSTVGTGRLAGIPYPAIIMVCLFGVFWFIANRTTFGRSIYAVGGNAEAARLAGISLLRVRVVVLGLSGLMAALSGILLAGSIGAGDPSVSQTLVFDVIAAVIVGGTDLFGGRGTLVGTAIGALLIGVLDDGLVELGVNQYAQQVAEGVIILVAVIIGSLRTSERRSHARRRLAQMTRR